MIHNEDSRKRRKGKAMRCTCENCGTYMIQKEDLKLGCVCPECGARCNACLGTKSVLSREEIAAMRENPEQVLARISEVFKNYE